MAIRIRRGNSSDRTTIIPESGEFLYDEDTDLVYIGDGVIYGGILVGGSGVLISVSDTNTVDLTVVANNLTADVRYQNTADVLLSDDASGLKADLTTTGVSPNTYGDGTNIPQLTVDSKGRITGVTNIPVIIPPTLTLETNGSPNGDQTLLNLKDGTNITITDDGVGGVTISSTPGVTLETNYSPNGSQTLLNLVEGQNINLTDNGLGSVTIDSLGGILHGTAAGTDTYTVTIAGVSSYNDGDAYLIRFTNGNTSTSTLNINGLGAKPLYRNNDGQLIGGDIWDGAEMLCVYNSTADDFQCIGTSPNSLFAYVTNGESIAITKGQPVYAFGGVGDRMKVKLAYNTTDATSAQTVGLVYSTSIAANQKGFIIIQGLLDNLSTLPTSTWSDGDPVYLGDTAGSKTPIKPYAPNHLVYLGVVTTASNGNAGRMYVRVQNGYELEELHDVAIHSPAPVNNDVLYYNSPTDLWKAAQIDTILGYSPVPSTRTISTTAPLSGGGDLSANRTLTTSMNTNRLIGRGTAGVGVMEEIILGTGLSLSGTTLNSTATIPTNTNLSQIFCEFNGQGGVIQPSYTGVSNITASGNITGWTIFSMNPSTGLALSGSIDVDIWVGAAGAVPVVAGSLFPVAGNRPKLTSQSYNNATGLSIAVTAGQTILARVISATTCVLVNLQFQITRS